VKLGPLLRGRLQFPRFSLAAQSHLHTCGPTPARTTIKTDPVFIVIKRFVKSTEDYWLTILIRDVAFCESALHAFECGLDLTKANV